MARNLDLTDEQWAVLDPLIPQRPRRTDGKGRPPRNRRDLLDGILWVLRTGAAWADLPERYPPHTTCHRWFQDWVRSGVLEGVLRALAADLKARGGWDLRECFIDGTFVPAQKGGPRWARPSGARAPSSWPWRTALVYLSPYPQPVLRRMR